jgi:hypothetical protein
MQYGRHITDHFDAEENGEQQYKADIQDIQGGQKALDFS